MLSSEANTLTSNNQDHVLLLPKNFVLQLTGPVFNPTGELSKVVSVSGFPLVPRRGRLDEEW